MNKTALVLGASPNKSRYSYSAVEFFAEKGYKVLPLGIRKGNIGKHEIILERGNYTNIDVVSLYLHPQNQHEWFTYIVGLKPNKVIFNPGAENEKFVKILQEKGIDSQYACSLVLLSTGLL